MRQKSIGKTYVDSTMKIHFIEENSLKLEKCNFITCMSKVEECTDFQINSKSNANKLIFTLITSFYYEPGVGYNLDDPVGSLLQVWKHARNRIFHMFNFMGGN